MKTEELELIQLIQDDYKKWKAGDNILIGAGMGAGKTRFALNILLEHAKINNKKILTLSNRTALKLENNLNIEKHNNKKFIKNITYQQLENDLSSGNYSLKWLDIFDYIICDECHYFLTDSWNNTSDISYEAILKTAKPIKIYMSATYINIFKILDEDIKKQGKNIIKYNTEQNFNQVEKIVFYEQDKYIENLIEELPADEKLIYFSKRINYLYELHNKYNNSSFVCSAGRENEEDNRYIITQDALVNNQLTNQLTFTTNVWDNGINIIDKDVKHVIIDITDIVTFIQCLGRRRQINNDKFILYVRNWTNEKLNQYMFYDKQRINKVDSFLKNSEEYLKLIRINKYKLDDMFYIDPITQRISINTLIYRNIINSKNRNKIAMEMGWDNYVKTILKIDNIEYENFYINNLKSYLKNIEGQKLYKEEQEELCNMIKKIKGVRVTGKTIQTNKLKKIFDELNLNYKVTDFREKKQDNKKQRRYIIINELKVS